MGLYFYGGIDVKKGKIKIVKFLGSFYFVGYVKVFLFFYKDIGLYNTKEEAKNAIDYYFDNKITYV